MLLSCIPAYRLPRDVVRKEIKALTDDENVTVETGKRLGKDITIDGILKDGYKAVFIAIGANKSTGLGLDGEDSEGVYPSMHFLKAYNLKGESLARGRVGVIGGGNSAIDSARVALRQPGVESVTIIYRRSRREMPAFAEEIDAALAEGVRLETLSSPVRVATKEGRLASVEFIRNRLGPVDTSGRRRPVEIPGSEYTLPLDTLIVAIGERVDSESLSDMGVEIGRTGAFKVDEATLATGRPGVFAGGDAVTGPNTVIEAIAAGKKAAVMIGKYLRGEPLEVAYAPKLPTQYVEPVEVGVEESMEAERAQPPVIAPEVRVKGFAEVEETLTEDAAVKEARRCLRCDLEFTETEKDQAECSQAGGSRA
jgi:NADH-quinone oxidoreductase subunit F